MNLFRVQFYDVIREACKWSPELAAACEVWKVAGRYGLLIIDP